MRLNNTGSHIAEIKQIVGQTWQTIFAKLLWRISITILKTRQASAFYLLEHAL